MFDVGDSGLDREEGSGEKVRNCLCSLRPLCGLFSEQGLLRLVTEELFLWRPILKLAARERLELVLGLLLKLEEL